MLPGGAVARLLEVLRASWRVEAHGLDRFDAMLASGRRGLVLFWHGKYVPLFVLLRDRRGCVFTSESKRGAAIGAICRHFGYECVCLPDRGGDSSLARMERALEGHGTTALAADGPLGPYHTVKRGPVLLASRLGFEVVPVSFAARPTLVARARWDRMELPLPFARVALELGDPLGVPRAVAESAEEVAAWSRRLHAALDAVDAAASDALSRAR